MNLSLGLTASTALAALHMTGLSGVSAFISPAKPSSPARFTNVPGLITASQAPRPRVVGSGLSMRAAEHHGLSDIAPATAASLSTDTIAESPEAFHQLTTAFNQFVTDGQPDQLTQLLSQHSGTHAARTFVDSHPVLHRAITSNSPQLFDAALALTNHPNAPDSDGNTPLHLAQNNPLLYYTQALLRSGADPNVPNNADETPLQRAAHTEHFGHVIVVANDF